MRFAYKLAIFVLLLIIAAGAFAPPAFKENLAYKLYDDLREYQDVRSVQQTQITGGDENWLADVIVDGGLKKLAVLATAVIEQVFGLDPQATTWFYFGSTLEDANGIGSAGDTIRVQIPAAPTPLDTVYPAVDLTYVVQASDVAASNPERTVAINVCNALRADSNFSTALWDCQVARDFAYVHINSRLFNEFGHRSSYTVTCSGTTVCSYGEADIKRRGKETELARSPNDPGRIGILSIAGTVTTLPGGIGDQFQERLVDNSNNYDMRVDGSVTPQIFKVLADNGGLNAKRRFISYLSCYGGGNGIKFGQFLSKNTKLTNGLLATIISEGETFSLLPIKSTEDFKNYFATEPGSDFRIDVQAGSDQFLAQFHPEQPIPLDPNSGDLVEIINRDNLTSGLSQLECLVFGFERDT